MDGDEQRSGLLGGRALGQHEPAAQHEPVVRLRVHLGERAGQLPDVARGGQPGRSLVDDVGVDTDGRRRRVDRVAQGVERPPVGGHGQRAVRARSGETCDATVRVAPEDGRVPLLVGREEERVVHR